MKVFVINLASEIQRRERMKQQLDQANISFEFFNAVSSEQDFPYSQRKDDQLTKKLFGYTLESRELACFASHYLLWQKCLELNETLVVLEDNCQLSEQFSHYFNNFNDIANRYKFIKLAVPRRRETTRFKRVETFDEKLSIIQLKRRVGSTSGYILTPEAAENFIRYATQFIEPVDDYMTKSFEHGIATYYLYPWPVKRAPLSSNIGSRKNKHGLKLIDKAVIESYRIYEQLRYKASILELNKSKHTNFAHKDTIN